MKSPKIAIADDHAIVRSGIASLLNSLGYKVEAAFDNGKSLLDYCRKHPIDLVLMDVNMPEMDGYEATRMLRDECPEVRVIALSMLNSESTLIRMIRAGAKSFVPKDASAEELDEALKGVIMKGYHYSQFVSSHLLTSLSMGGNESANSSEQGFSTRELEFLKLACSELTYRQIADKMFLSHRSIDGYRDALFHKLGLKSRVGLAVYAIREGLVEV